MSGILYFKLADTPKLTYVSFLALTGILFLSTSLSIHQYQDRGRKRNFWADVDFVLREVMGHSL